LCTEFKTSDSNAASAFSFLSAPLWAVSAYFALRANTIPVPFLSRFSRSGGGSSGGGGLTGGAQPTVSV
jgi:hypothetical protein